MCSRDFFRSKLRCLTSSAMLMLVLLRVSFGASGCFVKPGSFLNGSTTSSVSFSSLPKGSVGIVNFIRILMLMESLIHTTRFCPFVTILV
uniref:Putative secreted protein n=1 Tax=Anopheles triannulatus TaxID=58253 RepID=A0A2M4B7H1_9DIPT